MLVRDSACETPSLSVRTRVKSVRITASGTT
jgi:hypothetical protein